ncbi:MAG: TraR/DksA family transcriptional regulator [Acidobacteriota bacterium]|nr:TraR/DksA family transcriptional regulator [Acidobacteriota bacterium]
MSHPQSIGISDATMNGTQQYSQLLLTEKAQILFELSRRLESLNSGRVALEDQAPIVHEQFLAIRHNNFAYEKIKAIDAALDRLNLGDYGICEECDESIPEKRLKVVPWTRYCLHCQENLPSYNGLLAFRHLRAA